MSSLQAWSLVCLMILSAGTKASGQLSSTFYSSTCTNALSTIKSAVDAAVSKEARMGASLLRLHFHDCFPNGCDASILLDDTANFTGEKTAAPNLNSVRGFDVIDTIKANVEKVCPGIVSCADILAVAARDSVVALGGPTWTVQVGRRDATTATLSAANSSVAATTQNITAAYTSKGFTVKQMVALSGAHTIGLARCTSFRARLYNETSTINPAFAASLKSNCPSSGGDNNTAPLDARTSTKFDNAYFKNLLGSKGLLPSDQQLYSGGSGSTDAHVAHYSKSQSTFFSDFTAAMVYMGGLSVLTGSSGEVRTNCRESNS